MRDRAYIPCGSGLFFLVDVVDAHEGAGEGGYFAEGYEEGFVDLALGVDEDTAIEHYEATYTEEGGGEELDGKFVFHIVIVLNSLRLRRIVLIRKRTAPYSYFCVPNTQKNVSD